MRERERETEGKRERGKERERERNKGGKRNLYRSAITNPATLGPGGCRIIHFSGLLID